MFLETARTSALQALAERAVTLTAAQKSVVEVCKAVKGMLFGPQLTLP